MVRIILSSHKTPRPDALVPPDDAEPIKPAFPSDGGDEETPDRETLVPAVRADMSPCSSCCKPIVIRWSKSVPSTGSNKSLSCSPDLTLSPPAPPTSRWGKMGGEEPALEAEVVEVRLRGGEVFACEWE